MPGPRSAANPRARRGATSRYPPPPHSAIGFGTASPGNIVSGRRLCELAGRVADLMIAVEPDASLGERFDAASRYVRPDDVADAIPCGSDVGTFVQVVRGFTDAAFTHVALVQIGGDRQLPFIEWAASDPLPALRAAA